MALAVMLPGCYEVDMNNVNAEKWACVVHYTKRGTGGTDAVDMCNRAVNLKHGLPNGGHD